MFYHARPGNIVITLEPTIITYAWIRTHNWAILPPCPPRLPVCSISPGLPSPSPTANRANARYLNQARLERMASYDPLTGLFNREHFNTLLERQLASLEFTQSGLAVLFLDLDDFKPINDSFGHASGDELLVEISRRFKRLMRANDFTAHSTSSRPSTCAPMKSLASRPWHAGTIPSRAYSARSTSSM